MEHVLNYHEDHPNEHNNCHKLCDETWHRLLSLKESQWKWRQQHDQNFPMERKPFLKKYEYQQEEINLIEQDHESHSQEFKRES